MPIEFLKTDPSIVIPDNLQAEMTKSESNFLIQLLQKYQPEKIVEIGVACGGTSALVLQSTSQDQKVWEIDYAARWYRDKNVKVGYKVDALCGEEEKSRYTLLTGEDPVDALLKVGGDIDFCILDTMHSLPGELLQFFAIYKYLRPGAVLVLHDVSLNHNPLWKTNPKFKSPMIATKLLFACLGSHLKYLCDDEHMNIGAVVMDDLTQESLESVFFALGAPWHYYPDNLLLKYKLFLKDNYPPFFQQYFKKLMVDQKKLFN